MDGCRYLDDVAGDRPPAGVAFFVITNYGMAVRTDLVFREMQRDVLSSWAS